MNYSFFSLQRFLYSHYFSGGVRQATGVLLPALVLGGIFQLYAIGAVASIGAACVAILDQPGGPRRHGLNGMLGAIVLGSMTAAITGLASSYPLALLVVIPLLCFVFSMFTVFGKQGGLLGFACLLLMTFTMRTPLAPHDVALHTLYSLAGGAFYFAFSWTLHRLLWHRESLQAVSVALFSAADYMRVRSLFYDPDADLDDTWRALIRRQADMSEKHQATRNLVLRELPKGDSPGDHLRIATLNTFIDMLALLDTLIATQTDYATMRSRLGGSDILQFSHDALAKMANNLEHIALDVARNRRTATATQFSTKAELRAIEYELEKYRRSNMAHEEPETYALLVQVLRRLRNAARIVGRMHRHVRPDTDVVLIDDRLDRSLGRFLSRRDIRPGLLTSNLRLDSPHFRYALRVTLTIILAMSFSALLTRSHILDWVLPGFTSHSYWIVLTILVIMKPGYALTRQRNAKRLRGTLVGCGLALILFQVTDNLDVYVAVLVLTSILGYSFIQLSYQLSAVFNTVFVLLVFHFLSGSGTEAIGERLFDTVVASGFALGCSYILPWWEHNFMASLADAARRANREYFASALAYAESARSAQGQHEADLHWRVARQQAYIAFSNFASAFYRMMDEPVRQQIHVPEFNHLLIQNHILASQITAATPVLAGLEQIPPGIQGSLDAIWKFLHDEDADPPASIETEGELAALAYPIRQMVKAARLIRDEMLALKASSGIGPAQSPAGGGAIASALARPRLALGQLASGLRRNTRRSAED